jgi:hypothetical protein
VDAAEDRPEIRCNRVGSSLMAFNMVREVTEREVFIRIIFQVSPWV